jgi:lysophospholipid acyltransferase
LWERERHYTNCKGLAKIKEIKEYIVPELFINLLCDRKLLPPPVETKMQDIVDSLGLPAEVVRFGILLASEFILSIAYRLLPSNRTIRHLFSIISTCFLTVLVFNVRTIVENLSLCLLIYFIVSNFQSNRWTPVVCFVVALAFMSHVHYHCQVIYADQSSDHSAMMMVLLIKMSSFGFCCYDGTKQEKELDHYQQSHCIRKVPSLIEFLGYCFFFNGVWAGPAFEYRQYHNFIEEKVF